MIRAKTYSFNFRGGIVSPGYLKEILAAAELARARQIRFGLRQNMLIEIQPKYLRIFEEACKQQDIAVHEKPGAPPNVMSSYPSVHLYPEESWLREGVYKDVFDLFDYTPRVKINICEQHQSFVPLYTGHLNWITSALSHYWHLCIRLPGTDQIVTWPELIYTNNIASVSRIVEEFMLTSRVTVNGDGKWLTDGLAKALKRINYISRKNDDSVRLPKFTLPYYEGFNKSGDDYWLGINRRDELFDIAFLKDLCSVCHQTRIAQLYTTPWKSIMIRDIDMGQRDLWDYILGKYRVNVRHAANELNWQIEDCAEEGLAVKRAIIRYFDKEDVRTYGLCFAVQTKPGSFLYASVLIRKKELKNPHRLKSLERYDIMHTKDFNPNSTEWVTYRQDVKKEHLGPYLVSLCKLFYGWESKLDLLATEPERLPEAARQESAKDVFQCPGCLSIYDETQGDLAAGIPPGTAFEDIPDTYRCPVCEGDKGAFVTTRMDKLDFISSY
jgi:rubredoxin